MNDSIMSNKRIVRHVLLIISIYFLLHGFMLILTGTFHDDWLSYFHDVATKNMEGYESGRPYYSFVIELVWNLPGYGYRVLAFFTYLASYLFTYGIFCNIQEVGRCKALLITMISMALPINDARVLLANYPYALGMMFFFAGGYVLTRNLQKINKIWIRLSVLFLFLLSFTLNSNLVLYGIVILYLIIKNGPQKVYTIIDFIAIPILFFVINQKLFPVYGAYTNYNLVTLDRVKWALKSTPEIITETYVSLVRIIGKENTKVWIVLLLVSFFLLAVRLFIRKRNKQEDNQEQTANGEQRDGILFLMGTIALVAGLLSYTVVRQYPNIAITGIQGRDSIQMGLGVAMMVIGGANRRIRTGVVSFIVFAGMFHFNTWYMNYQTEWYRQLAYQKKIVEVDDVFEGGNFIVNCSQPSPVADRRFYTWSGNTAAATGRRNVFILNGERDTDILNNSGSMESILSHYPMFSEYEYKQEVTGIIDYQVNISNEDALHMKVLELFDQKQFTEAITEIGNIVYQRKK